MDAREIPRFNDLPTLERLGLRHSWGVFGDDDDLGTVNRLTPERVAEAAGLVRTGEVLDLTLPMTLPEPPLYGRSPLKHTIFAADRNNRDERLDDFFPQGSSQWDGLRHVRCREHGFYGGVTDEPAVGPGRLGIEHWVRHGMVGRGVLLDLAGHLAALGQELDPWRQRSVSPDDLAATAQRQQIELRPGDILCVRFGWTEAYLAADDGRRAALAQEMAFPGLSAGEDSARFLWDCGAAAIACDNPAVEVSPGDPAVGSLHRRLVPLLGMALGELFHFGDLVRACRADGRWEFLFVAVPLHVPGAVGSPANAVAIR